MIPVKPCCVDYATSERKTDNGKNKPGYRHSLVLHRTFSKALHDIVVEK